MKILVMGQPPKPKVFLGKCHVCESQLEATADEVKLISPPQIGEREGKSTAICPVCKDPRGVVFYPK